MLKINVAPSNSLLFLSDVAGGEPPEPTRAVAILATRSCISFPCYPEQDGSTEIAVGTRAEVGWHAPPAFEGDLETPSRRVAISTVLDETVLTAGVANTKTHVCIWLSHPLWPRQIAIGLG